MNFRIRGVTLLSLRSRRSGASRAPALMWSAALPSSPALTWRVSRRAQARVTPKPGARPAVGLLGSRRERGRGVRSGQTESNPSCGLNLLFSQMGGILPARGTKGPRRCCNHAAQALGASFRIVQFLQLCGTGRPVLITVSPCPIHVISMFPTRASFTLGAFFPHRSAAWGYFTVVGRPCINCRNLCPAKSTCFSSRWDADVVGGTNTLPPLVSQ